MVQHRGAGWQWFAGKPGSQSYLCRRYRRVAIPAVEPSRLARGGKANDTHIGFEICEDKGWNKDYFDAAWGNAVALTVYLCRMLVREKT